jgi:Cu-Zn family superoxide dismutase
MSTLTWFVTALGVAAAASSQLGADAAPKAKGVLRDSVGTEVGTMEAEMVGGGLRIIVKVHDVPPGEHGIHVHTGSSCGPGTGDAAFEEAGPHFDPAAANTHAGLNGDGHGGDLGNIAVGGDRTGKIDVVAADLSLDPGKSSVAGRTIILHAKRDNLTNTPKNGGSGGRLACGVLERQN